MSKTPDEIVKALKCCGANLPCYYCPYFDECACDCMSSLNNDAAALIDSLQSQLAETKRQFIAAVNDLNRMADGTPCTVCRHKSRVPCTTSQHADCFEWRGPQDEKGATE
jgi:hypothetical protein